MYKWGFGLAVLAACTHGSAGSSSSSTLGDHATATSSDDIAATTTPAAAQQRELPPYPVAPADPWRGVINDQPRKWTQERVDRWVLRTDAAECTAAHDHCIDPDAWFLVHEGDRAPVTAGWEVFGPDGAPAHAPNAKRAAVDAGWTALRSVPATKTSLAPGTAAIALDRDAGTLTSGIASHDATWWYGIVDTIDLGGGTFTLKGRTEPFALTGARVVVLTWKAGGKVQIAGGKPREGLGVKASETFGAE